MRLAQKLIVSTMLLWGFLFVSCEAIISTDEGDLTDYTCEGCHTNRKALSDIINFLNLDPPDEGHAAPG